MNRLITASAFRSRTRAHMTRIQSMCARVVLCVKHIFTHVAIHFDACTCCTLRSPTHTHRAESTRDTHTNCSSRTAGWVCVCVNGTIIYPEWLSLCVHTEQCAHTNGVVCVFVCAHVTDGRTMAQQCGARIALLCPMVRGVLNGAANICIMHQWPSYRCR